MGVDRIDRTTGRSGGTAPDKAGALRVAAVVYAAGLLLHTADHFRRGVDATSAQVVWLGSLGIVLGVAVITMALLRHPKAPLIAVGFGFAKALGVSAVHLLPGWFGPFSDSFLGADVDVLSWAAVLVEIGGALALGISGLVALRPRFRVQTA
jgi:CHASE2 domain-containing sensor protein